MDKLLVYLLKHIEGSPRAQFYERELTNISASGFSALKKQKYLLFDQYDFEQESYFDKCGREYFIRKTNGKWVGTSTEDSRISPISLTERDLNRYIFSVRPLLEKIKAANGLNRNIDAVSPRIWFIGETTIIQDSVGIFVAFLSDSEQAEAELLGLRAKIGAVDKILVLCPSYEIKSQDLLNRLAKQNIACRTFKDAFKKDYMIDFGKIHFEQGEGRQTLRLTAKQKTDYTKYRYQCYDRLYIPGTASRERSNDIMVNGQKIKMPDELFRLLVELTVALKRGKGGWVPKATEADKYQIFSRLRTQFQGSLLERDAKKFIENDGSKSYRISTHPDFVSYDRANLMKHPDSVVKGFAKKLPRGNSTYDASS